ncbi:hypothetical protein ACTXT7_009718 [Hymenolepis weldensis]
MGQGITSKEEVEMKLVSFLESKLAKFYEEGIRKLMTRWEDIGETGASQTDREGGSSIYQWFFRMHGRLEASNVIKEVQIYSITMMKRRR